MIDKLLDILLAKMVSTAVWKTICTLALLPTYHLVALGLVIFASICFIREIKRT